MKSRKYFLLLLSIIVVLFYLFPFYIVVVNAFKTPMETAGNALAFPAGIFTRRTTGSITLPRTGKTWSSLSPILRTEERRKAE